MIQRIRLGDMLVEAGLLTREQLDRAVAERADPSMRLSDVLIQRGLVSEADIVGLMSRQLGVECYHPAQHELDTSLADVVPVAVAQKNQGVPLCRRDGVLLLAMVDPTDIHALDAIEEIVGMEVEPVICTTVEYNQLMTQLYIGSSSLTDGLDQLKYSSEKEDSEQETVQVASLYDLAAGAPVVRMANWLVAQAVREGASDIHISPEKNTMQIRFRIDGRLRDIPAPQKSMFLPLISRMKILAGMDIAVSRIPQDGRFTIRLDNREINIRASTVPTVNGENLVLRLLDTSAGLYSLEALGMAAADREKIEKALRKPHGMILNTGPTGSGKTTTLYGILQIINQPDINILTVEDPVEYRMSRIRQVQLNAKAGMTFSSGLRSLLRQDPDVIMVGEIRDAETARIAVQASLTGHLVLSTLHTNDALGAITRLIDLGVEPFLVASVLVVALAQRLVRKICPDCKQPCVVSPEIARYLGFDEPPTFYRGVGCPKCRNTGYKGRTGVFEVLNVDKTIQEMIVRRASSKEIVEYAGQASHQTTLKEDAVRTALEGITSLEDLLSVIMD